MPDGIGERCCTGNTGATGVPCPQQPDLGHGGENVRLLWNLFVVFTRVALYFLGAAARPRLALMQREVVAAGWANSAEFADAVAVGNALPGPIAPQVSAFVGYKVAGFSAQS
jgi:chromate transport protein ChrA